MAIVVTKLFYDLIIYDLTHSGWWASIIYQIGQKVDIKSMPTKWYD